MQSYMLLFLLEVRHCIDLVGRRCSFFLIFYFSTAVRGPMIEKQQVTNELGYVCTISVVVMRDNQSYFHFCQPLPSLVASATTSYLPLIRNLPRNSRECEQRDCKKGI